jgi:hypothetical protein
MPFWTMATVRLHTTGTCGTAVGAHQGNRGELELGCGKRFWTRRVIGDRT